MKIALAACSGMSSDAAAAPAASATTTRPRSGCPDPADREQERYPLLEERMELDLSGLSEDEVARLLDRRRAGRRSGVHGRPHAEVRDQSDV